MNVLPGVLLTGGWETIDAITLSNKTGLSLCYRET
ncbi:hypothetical protein BN2127_JRS7_02682 [Bacillus subtilis]|nr:hypothetical protein BN2127_JRS1_07928 [Bacillus cereus]CUB41748.1 hypothetical protein BN2127_JRS7_02682 [Bacillus subtilis]